MSNNVIEDGGKGENGAVLIWVFWLLLAISVIALGALHLSTTHYGLISAHVSRVEMRHAAEGALHHAIYDSLQENVRAGRRTRSSFKRTYEIGAFNINVSRQKETGKISLNKADEALLSAAFAAYGVGEMEALRIAAAIVDWRDGDNLPRPDGAEAGQYGAHVPAPRNAAFETLGELRLVKGIDDALFACLYPVFSVYSASEYVDLGAADPRVVPILQWADDNHWYDRDWQTSAQGQSVLNPYAGTGGDVYRFTAHVTGAGQHSMTIEAVVRLSKNTVGGHDVLALYEIFQGQGNKRDSCFK